MKPKETNTDQQSQPKKKYQPPKEVRTEHQEFLTKVGLKLQALRKERGISISRLSSTLGISRNKYALMEKGLVYCNVLSFLQVLDFFQINAKEFFKDLESNQESGKY